MKRFFGKNLASSLVDEFDQYLRGGGFPKSVQYDSADDRRTYIEGVVATRNDPLQNRNGIIHVNLPEFMRDGIMF